MFAAEAFDPPGGDLLPLPETRLPLSSPTNLAQRSKLRQTPSGLRMFILPQSQGRTRGGALKAP